MTLDQPYQIEAFGLLQLKSRLKLEMVGLKSRGQSAYAILKSKYGYRGSRQKVYDHFVMDLKEIGVLKENAK
tara:strand:+ start:1891 stop:2106 length:216 start_codon:yes stop_codon:yes gene_type:complete